MAEMNLEMKIMSNSNFPPSLDKAKSLKIDLMTRFICKKFYHKQIPKRLSANLSLPISFWMLKILNRFQKMICFQTKIINSNQNFHLNK